MKTVMEIPFKDLLNISLIALQRSGVLDGFPMVNKGQNMLEVVVLSMTP